MDKIFGKAWEILIFADKVNINLDNILNIRLFLIYLLI